MSCILPGRDHVISCDIHCDSMCTFSHAGVRVSFQQQVYSVGEGNGSVAVCVEISVTELHIELIFNLSAAFDGSTIFSGTICMRVCAILAANLSN